MGAPRSSDKRLMDNQYWNCASVTKRCDDLGLNAQGGVSPPQRRRFAAISSPANNCPLFRRFLL